MVVKDLKDFKVILIGVIFDPQKKKILIGKRDKDPYFENLSWVFPGGRAEYGEDLDKILKRRVLAQTGYEVKNLGAIFAKEYPEKENFISIYFLCEALKGKEKAGEKLKELKWVSPKEIENYFETSFHPRLKEYLINLS